MSQSKWVQVGSVRRFDEVWPDKVQALKVGEEVMEVFSAWEDLRDDGVYDTDGALDFENPYTNALVECLLLECADVIQATLNLVAALGVEDFRPYLKECERRNRERGRITDGKVVDE